MEKTVFVIGLGLIGGSLALAIKAQHPGTSIIGYDVNEDQMRLAKSLKAVDEISLSLEGGAKAADFIVIAVPVTQAERILGELESLPLKPGVIVTDVGSTKRQLVEQSERLTRKGIRFIGGHPMAGSHKTGVTAAKVHLFENAFYVLTPSSNVSSQDMDSLMELLKGTKAQFIALSAAEHDEIAGVISHFPHIIAASLVHQTEKYQQRHELVTKLAAGGFRDITRIASSSPAMWRDILLHNKEVLLPMFDQWLGEMKEIRSMIEKEDGDQIFDYFSKAKQFRDGLPVKTKGAIPSFYDLYVDVPDYPGVISDVTKHLAEKEISITNIRILETREDIYGVLRLSFQTEEDRGKAKTCLELHSYEVFLPL
jgi:prephenate dehydrogenase